MGSIATSLIVFACVSGGAICGALLSRALPPHHLSTESKNAVTISMGLVVTMAALVLGLLISSAKGFFDAQRTELTQMSARVVLLDRLLAHYGPETKGIRDQLRTAVATTMDKIWPHGRTKPSQLIAPETASETLLVKIQELSPHDDRQRSLQAQALSITVGLMQTRWLMYEQGADSVSGPMLAIFLILEMYSPFGGVIEISSAPVRAALAHLGQ